MITLTAALERWNSDVLMQYVALLGAGKGVTRKADRIEVVRRHLLEKEHLRRVWQQLDPVAQRAVSNAYHHDGVFDPQAFVAQYGQLPPRPQKDKWGYYGWQEPILFDLFVINNEIPSDLLPLLADLALPVERFRLEGVEALPATAQRYAAACPIIEAETEVVGRTDLLTYLQLVEQGALKWSEKNRELTAASVRKVMANLVMGDFYEEPDTVTGRSVVRPFGLDMFAQGAGLVTNAGKLSPAGRRYLQTQDPHLFLEAFERWVEEGKFDELTRIRELNGLNARGTRLTPPASRREKVIEALSWCPTHTWIYFQDFYRAVKIWHFDFEVEATAWSNLYAGPYKEYGTMDDGNYWKIVKGLYINAIIMEYLATIGAVDIGYVAEEVSFIDSSVHYTDERFSLHDGLLYFRINNWGAFLLGQADGYTPAQPPQRALFTIDSGLRVYLVGDLRPNEQLQLEAMAIPVGEKVYQLDRAKWLAAVEGGQQFDYLAEFLQANHLGPLPADAGRWLAELKRQVHLFKEGSAAVMIQLNDQGARAVIEQDAALAKVCRLLDDGTGVVLSSNLNRFRKRLREMGYLLGTR